MNDNQPQTPLEPRIVTRYCPACRGSGRSAYSQYGHCNTCGGDGELEFEIDDDDEEYREEE